MNNQKFYYPLTIDSTFSKVKIDSGLFLRKITSSEVEKFFGIKNRKLSSDFKTFSGDTVPTNYLSFGNSVNNILSNSQYLFNSNYMLVATNGAIDALTFNFALKLLSRGGPSGLYVSYNNFTPSMQFFYPNPYFKDGMRLNLNSVNKKKLIELYLEIKKSIKIQKLILLRELFLSALSGSKMRNETRFLDLVTILESLYFPETNTVEINYKLSIRVAKILEKYYGEDPVNIFDILSKNKMGLYSIRSKIIHTGSSENLNSNSLNTLTKIVCQSLVLYIKDRSAFEEANLKTLVLKN